jgi:anti-sigma B factor antagonist
MQLPERLKLSEAQLFLRDVEPLLQADHPRIVFDFAQVRELDSAGVDMLLHCMEQAMKQDGDLKLASVPPHSAVILELTRVDRLFETFPTTSDAVESFQNFPLQVMQSLPPQYSDMATENRNRLADLKIAG